MIRKWALIACGIFILGIGAGIFTANAAANMPPPGLPNSPEFGYGSVLDPYGIYVDDSINLAKNIGIRWISLEFNWSKRWPDPNQYPDLDQLGLTINKVKNQEQYILVSITNPPDWAMADNGPDPRITAHLVTSLARVYSGAIQVVELYPGANTEAGWHAKPDPKAALQVLKSSIDALESYQLDVYPILSLTPVKDGASLFDWNDLVFLKGLYDLGAAELMPIIGLSFAQIQGVPMADPDAWDKNVLRHYELVRKIMLENNHQQGLVWITRFSWPNSYTDPNMKLPDAQAYWLNQAYELMKGQLYLGAAFFARINPPSVDSQISSLIFPDHRLHPAAPMLSQWLDATSYTSTFSSVQIETENHPSLQMLTKRNTSKAISKGDGL